MMKIVFQQFTGLYCWDNSKSVIAVINDRDSYIKNRITDLSKEIFKRIAVLNKGVIPVKVETVKIKILFLKGKK